MNLHESDIELLLLGSGELPPERKAVLEKELQSNPDLQKRADELQLLQDAGRFASRQTVPPLPDLRMEAILSAASGTKPKTLPRLLAVAAGLVVALALWPLLLTPQNPSDYTQITTEPHSTLPLNLDESWQGLEELQEELAVWQDTSLTDLLTVEDETYWAEQLLTDGESS